MFMTLVSVRPTHQNGACTSRLDLPDMLYVQALSLVVRDEADADLKRFCQSWRTLLALLPHNYLIQNVWHAKEDWRLGASVFNNCLANLQ